MTHTLLTFLANYGYLAIFLLMLAESACIPVPSEVTMLVGGALASNAFAASNNTHSLNLIAVGLIGTAGNLVGSWIAWGVGYRGGRQAVERWGKYVALNNSHLDRADAWFVRHGFLSVFATRLLPVIRTFISLPAGIARMSFVKFTVYTTLGCLPWTFALAITGHALGNRWTTAEQALKPLTYIVVAIIVVVIAGWFLKRRKATSASISN